MGYGIFNLFAIIEYCSTVVSNDDGPGFFLGIWLLRYQPSVSLPFVRFFRKEVNAHVVVKDVMLIQLADEMEYLSSTAPHAFIHRHHLSLDQ